MINYSILLEVGHFNFPQIGHYHFRATGLAKNDTMKPLEWLANIDLSPADDQRYL